MSNTSNQGEISVNETVVYTFRIKNTGNNPLKINEILTHEGDCLVAEYDDSEIPVDDFTDIDIKFLSSSIGKFEKNILIEANTAPPFHVLTINGEVK